ncbi:hypothetical protein JZ751_013066 [Albula glossodonta]|uniref:F-BAR domain-containing protein n=1 Tax=Albula glossodonta TaxID=121402 RepID=A0A8T2P228_9TELE|nr:hypothetical protein JZ751_013066 [Albula glossodonta]
MLRAAEGSVYVAEDQTTVWVQNSGVSPVTPRVWGPRWINCVTFPIPSTVPEQPLLKPSDWSYCDYFWVSDSTDRLFLGRRGLSVLIAIETAQTGDVAGLEPAPLLALSSGFLLFRCELPVMLLPHPTNGKADKRDPQGGTGVTGFEVLLQKQLKGKQMQKEMAEFVRESTGFLCSRIKIEEEYAKNLSKLSQIPLAAQEEGTLREAWAQLKKSLADEADVHLKFSSKLHSEVERPLLTFREHFKKDMKKYDHHIADLRKQLSGRYAAVEKARRALADRQKDLEVKTQQLEIRLSNKTEEDIKKARRKSTQAGEERFKQKHCAWAVNASLSVYIPEGSSHQGIGSDELMRCVDLYNQAQSKWFEEMVTTSLELERLEVERVEMIRQHLRQYTTLRHETDMFNQSTVEPVDQLLQSVDPAKDRELWVMENKTGEIRPVDMDI